MGIDADPTIRPDDGSRPPVHVELFGAVALRTGAERFPVEGDDLRPHPRCPTRVSIPLGKAREILAMLAATPGRTVSVETIVDALWAEPPASGRNAVQRHVSSLRTAVRSAGVDVGDTWIGFDGSGYRLDPLLVTSDARVVEEWMAHPEQATSYFSEVAWWEAPLAELPWEPFVGLRARLDAAAATLACRFADALAATDRHAAIIERVEPVALRHRYDDALWARLAIAIRNGSGDHALAQLRARILSIYAEVAIAPGAELATLLEPSAPAWSPAGTAAWRHPSFASASPRRSPDLCRRHRPRMPRKP